MPEITNEKLEDIDNNTFNMLNIVEPILQPIYNRIDKILKVFEDISESINDIAQFLYIKDEKKVIRETLKGATIEDKKAMLRVDG